MAATAAWLPKRWGSTARPSIESYARTGIQKNPELSDAVLARRQPLTPRARATESSPPLSPPLTPPALHPPEKRLFSFEGGGFTGRATARRRGGRATTAAVSRAW